MVLLSLVGISLAVWPRLASARIAHRDTADNIKNSNTLAPDGYLRFDFGAIYQLEPNLSLTGRFGVTLDDFEGNDTASNLRGQILFSPKSRIDVIGVMGFDRLDDAKETFHVNGAIAIRI